MFNARFFTKLLIGLVLLSSFNSPIVSSHIISNQEVQEPRQEQFGTGFLGSGFTEENKIESLDKLPFVKIDDALPDSFDWRNVNGTNWMTPVKNQGNFGSCVAFGVLGALEVYMKSYYNDSNWDIDLSEQHLFEFGGGTPDGWYIDAALDYLEFYGTPEEWCNPYDYEKMFDYTTYEDWRMYTSKIKWWSWTDDVYWIKELLLYTPVITYLDIYTNFYSYEGGVFTPSGDYWGGHCVTLVGYNDTGGYWVCKNSWGDSWGEDGYFRIAYGECRIAEGVAFFDIIDNRYPNFWLNIHRLSVSDPVESVFENEAEWEYLIWVYDGIYEEMDVGVVDLPYSDWGDDIVIDHNYRYTVDNDTIRVDLALIEIDYSTNDDLTDISSFVGGGIDNFNGTIPRGAYFRGYYTVSNDTFSGDYFEIDEGYYLTSGEFDGSTEIDENDANLWFKPNNVKPKDSLLLSEFNYLYSSSNVKVIFPSDNSSKPLDCVAASVSDWLASAYVNSKLGDINEGMDVEESYLNQTTGKPVGDAGIRIVSFGGPIVNPLVKYSENNETPVEDRAPVKFHDEGGIFHFQYINGTNIEGAELPLSVINSDEDMFLIEMFEDGHGRNILICYGFGWKGTYAAGKYFNNEIYPYLESYPYNWIIVKWEDTNGNGFVNSEIDGDTYTLMAHS
jgi:C1A family cysteine protease